MRCVDNTKKIMRFFKLQCDGAMKCCIGDVSYQYERLIFSGLLTKNPEPIETKFRQVYDRAKIMQNTKIY